jgi:anti-sigma factor RsiW
VASDDYTRLLHAHFDGELDLVRSLEVEEHLKGCPDCAQDLWIQQTLRKAFRSANLYHPAPEGLKIWIRAALPREKVIPIQRREALRWVAVAAVILSAFALTWRILPRIKDLSQADLLAQEIVSSHIRSLQPGHLVDIESTDQHTVKPWFNGKIDFSPPVNDYAGQGSPLVGGRLDYIDHRNVAALVYRRNRHLINVYVWPEPEKESDVDPESVTAEGYHLIFWQQGGMYFCAVSDLNAHDLQQFAELLQK